MVFRDYININSISQVGLGWGFLLVFVCVGFYKESRCLLLCCCIHHSIS